MLCLYPVTKAATVVATQTRVKILVQTVFRLVSKRGDLADVEVRTNLLREKFSNGSPPVMLAAMEKHSNTNSVYVEQWNRHRIIGALLA